MFNFESGPLTRSGSVPTDYKIPDPDLKTKERSETLDAGQLLPPPPDAGDAAARHGYATAADSCWVSFLVMQQQQIPVGYPFWSCSSSSRFLSDTLSGHATAADYCRAFLSCNSSQFMLDEISGLAAVADSCRVTFLVMQQQQIPVG